MDRALRNRINNHNPDGYMDRPPSVNDYNAFKQYVIITYGEDTWKEYNTVDPNWGETISEYE